MQQNLGLRIIYVTKIYFYVLLVTTANDKNQITCRRMNVKSKDGALEALPYQKC